MQKRKKEGKREKKSFSQRQKRQFQGPAPLLTDRPSVRVLSRRFKLAAVDVAVRELLKAGKKGKSPYRCMCIQF